MAKRTFKPMQKYITKPRKKFNLQAKIDKELVLAVSKMLKKHNIKWTKLLTVALVKYLDEAGVRHNFGDLL
jgi:hypothetical protein